LCSFRIKRLIKKLTFAVTLLAVLWVFVYPQVEHWFGPLGLWGALSGKNLAEGDLVPVEFADLVRRSTPNDALVCGEGVCPMAAADRVAPVFEVAPSELLARLDQLLRAVAGSEALYVGPEANRLRFVFKTKWMRFPDVVDAEVFAVAPNRSTLALYSRSVVGRNDQGVNKARLNMFMDQLVAALMPDRSASN
jgi:uncharacterized protein (DUF1499 family)